MAVKFLRVPDTVSMCSFNNKRKVIRALRHAVRWDRSQFSVVYQPKINLTSKNLVGMEALLRWNNDKVGRIGPAEFIPIAETHKLIDDLLEIVLSLVCTQINIWKTQLQKDIRVSVNISPVQLNRINLIKEVKDTLDKHLIPYENVEIEVTEGTYLTPVAIDTIKKFSDEGFPISLDDFGKDYASFNRFLALPLNFLKIDKDFLKQCMEEEKGRRFINDIIKTCHKRNIQVIAEGIETQAQLNELIQSKCDIGQGYLFDKPMANPNLEKWYLTTI
ncbi:EAL domain-containing protein (plasmid) [Rossellomorea marisflavi]|uniref:EAL domain-containing protein n=1 Tax=Rossellomorea marisflavi TaxID=189381 RepID=UPI001316F680|nr:EAL domain-containing protein [Rossellomorea marisflavi]QHA38761.1 EAL domain-containing protein [Rossellomorea marisflavi]